jgi:hypothetical protein
LKRTLAALLSAAALCGTAIAASDAGSPRYERRYDTVLSYRLEPNAQVRGFVMVDLKMVARVWTQMGEPVVYCSASWKLRNAMVEFNRGGRWLTAPEMPEAVWNAVDLVDATIGLPIALKNQSFRKTSLAWVPCDIGASNANGDPRGSFNVPGSPDWSRLLLLPSVPYDHAVDWDKASN